MSWANSNFVKNSYFVIIYQNFHKNEIKVKQLVDYKITVKTYFFRLRPNFEGPLFLLPKKLMAQIMEADVNDSIIYGWVYSIMFFVGYLLDECLANRVIFV